MTIRDRLFALQDKSYAAFTARLVPNVEAGRVVGVRAPAMRRLAKELKGSPEADAFVRSLPHYYLEEYGLHAALINGMADYDLALAEVERLLPYVDNWATCDSLSPVAFAKHSACLLPEVRRWMASPHDYTCRFGIGMLMRYFLDALLFNPEQLQWVADIEREEYYVGMMQAWYFATALAKQPEPTEAYMQRGRMREWVRRKTIQKALESFRVAAPLKEELRRLRNDK